MNALIYNRDNGELLNNGVISKPVKSGNKMWIPINEVIKEVVVYSCRTTKINNIPTQIIIVLYNEKKV